MDISYKAICPRTACRHENDVNADTNGIIDVMCSKCGRKYYFFPNISSITPLAFWAITVFVIVTNPFIWLDKVVWSILNTVSEAIQHIFIISKYWPALIFLCAAIVIIGIAEPLIILGVLWAFILHDKITWLWRKARSESFDTEREVLNLHDTMVIASSRIWRWYLLPTVPVVGIIDIMSNDHMLTLPVMAFTMMMIGFYWMDSRYVPPRHRSLIRHLIAKPTA